MQQGLLKPGVVYEDKAVRVDGEAVYIKWYYFPTATSKKIRFSRIKRVERVEPAIGVTKGWGMALTPIWWACDLWRSISNKPCMVIYTMDYPTPFNPGAGFTPEDFETLNRIIGEGMERSGAPKVPQ